MKSLIERFVKQDPLKKLTKPEKWARLDVADIDSHKGYDHVDSSVSVNKKSKELMNKDKSQ